MTKRACQREKRFEVGDLVLVEWIDSRGASSGWTELDVLKEYGVCSIKSVGWLIRRDKNVIHIVPHIGTDPDQGCGDMAIPRSQVSKMRKVK